MCAHAGVKFVWFFLLCSVLSDCDSFKFVWFIPSSVLVVLLLISLQCLYLVVLSVVVLVLSFKYLYTAVMLLTLVL